MSGIIKVVLRLMGGGWKLRQLATTTASATDYCCGRLPHLQIAVQTAYGYPRAPVSGRVQLIDAKECRCIFYFQSVDVNLDASV